MKIVFFGTPYYVIPILDALHKAFKVQGESPIEAVVTQPPRPSGRKQQVEYSAVDKWAHEKNIPIFLDSEKIIERGVKADLGVLASYGALIPEKIITHFPKGILVIHPSILPEFRGSSPVPAMIATDSNNVGCTIFKMDKKWDHGPIVTSFKDELLPNDNYQTLRDRLFERSAEVLVQALPAYTSGKINLKPQDDSKASFARMIKKIDAFIDPVHLEKALADKPSKLKWKIDFIKINGKPYTTNYSPPTIHSFVRAMTPWPGAWTEIQMGPSGKYVKRLKITKTHLEDSKLVLDEVQLEGKNPVSWRQFKAGYPNAKLI